jgi:hypothetical protein
MKDANYTRDARDTRDTRDTRDALNHAIFFNSFPYFIA